MALRIVEPTIPVANGEALIHAGIVFKGFAFGGELELKDESGHRLFKEDYDPAPFVGARLLWQF